MAKSKEKLEVINKSSVKTTLPLNYLTPLQGELKSLSPEASKKLRKSILTHGFIYPIFTWENPEDAKICIIDGHQRYKVLSELKDEGYKIPQLPVIEIPADDLKDAKRKLAAAASNFGKFNEEGVQDFFADFDPIELGDFEIPFLDLVGLDPEPTEESEPEKTVVSEHEREINKPKEEKHDHECPKCGYTWDR